MRRRATIRAMGPSAAALRAAAVVGLVVAVGLALPPLAAALRPLRERVASAGAASSSGSWGDEVRTPRRDWEVSSPHHFCRGGLGEFGPDGVVQLKRRGRGELGRDICFALR